MWGSENLPVLSVTGVSHHTCPIDVRERFALPEGGQPPPADGRTIESAWLATCNRTELYALSEDAGTAGVVFAEALGAPADLTERYRYTLDETDAARHLFRVASGLDSLVLGEHEVLGQVRNALGRAREHGSAGPVLSRLFQDALTAGRRVRSETEISRWPVSMSGAAASILLERQGLETLERTYVLVIGAGEMARGVARCLQGMQARELAIANRTPERARDLARESGGEALDWPLAPEALARFDAIVSCTSAPGFVLTRETVEATARLLPPARSIHLVDLAVPRDIDPEAGSIAAVHLSNLDDARGIVDDSLSRRSEHIEPAERIIEEQIACFREWTAARSASDSIRALKERADSIRQRELDWVMPKLAGLSERERAAVEQFSSRLVNKLLHTPTRHLRETAGRSEGDALGDLLLQAFDLDGEDPKDGS